VELERERGATALVLEYHDGEPLDRLIAGPMEVGAFLRVRSIDSRSDLYGALENPSTPPHLVSARTERRERFPTHERRVP
jgi:hypothetical protein